MKLIQTSLNDCYLIEPTIFEDDRGYFYEKFNENKFQELTSITGRFIQDNISKSSYGVLRGIHLQKGEHAQAKLVSCIEGCVWDIAVDLRRNSSTFGKWFGVELSAENKKQLYIPRGFGHGFSVLSQTAIFSYKCDNYYNKESEGGLLWNDMDINIDWKLPEKDILLSEKDKIQATFIEGNF